VMEAPPEAIDRFRPRNRLAGKPELLAHARPAGVREVRLGLPAAAQAVLGRVVPPVTFRPAPTPSMAVVVGDGDEELALTDELSLVG